MHTIRFICLALLALVFLSVTPIQAMAAPSMTPIPPTAHISVLQPIADQLGQQLQALVATPPAPDEGDDTPVPTFGTRALNVVINITEILRNEGQNFITNFTALPQLSDWLKQQQTDPRLADHWSNIGNDLLATAGIAFLGGVALELLLYPVRRQIRKRVPRNSVSKLMSIAALFFLRAVPIVVFLAVSVTLLNQDETHKVPRFIIMNIVYALALVRTAMLVIRGILSPRNDALRFVPASDAQALYGYRWLRAFSLLIIVGYSLLGIVRAVHVPDAAINAFTNILGLVFVVMGIVVIVQKRAFVAQMMRGDLSAAHHNLSGFDTLRLWFARQWHMLAIAYLVIGYLVAALGVQDGLVLMLRGTFLTLFDVIVTRLLLREITLWEAHSKKGTTLYTLVKGGFLRVIVFSVAIASGLAAWGVNVLALANTTLGQRLLGSAFSIGMTLLILGLIYEFFSCAVDKHLTPKTANGKPVEVNARARTLLPMLRNALLVLFMCIIGIVVLSEAGINIGPLLAGAGVLGVAVGFGSQTLVKDFLTGLFIVLENTIAVGDVIKVGDHSGVVEAMSMRTLRLRDMDGALHILPFSEVSQIINMTRDFAHAVIKVNVASNTNVETAMEAIRIVGEQMRADPAMKYAILAPVEILGIDSLNDASITLVATMRTQPGQQWSVKRRFLLRLKQQFEKDGVQLPTSSTILVHKSLPDTTA